jgi:hypothetical protein
LLDELQLQSMLDVSPYLTTAAKTPDSTLGLGDAIWFAQRAVDHPAISQPAWRILAAKTCVCNREPAEILA